jgi:hypothetical protein
MEKVRGRKLDYAIEVVLGNLLQFWTFEKSG